MLIELSKNKEQYVNVIFILVKFFLLLLNMCLAIPGKIKSIKTKTALVDYGFEIREVMLDPRIKIEVGNYVLVQMGMIIKRVSDKDAEVSLEEWKKATANIQGNSSS